MAAARARYLIDTNVWSHMQRRTSAAMTARFAKLHIDQVFLSPIVLGELEVGFLKGDRAAHRRAALDHIVSNAQILPIGREVSAAYALLRTTLEQAGTPIGPNDTWIAAEALHHKLVLVTDNVREFERVPKLRVENWL
jgi:tRNA(fMet)-specific endonuclease VapC